MSLNPISHGSYIRGVQSGLGELTHEVEIRSVALADFGPAFTKAYSSAFQNMPSLRSPKAEYFIFIERGSSATGILLRIRRIMDVEERREYVNVLCEEIEEQGAG
jgi:hypothetical protein